MTDQLERVRRSARLEQERRHQDFLAEQRNFEEEMRETAAKLSRWLNAYTRRAGPADYKAWLDAWIAAGGKITHAYPYRMPNEFHVLTRQPPENDPLPAAYGAQSVSVIVPAGLHLPDSRRGHNNLYLYDPLTAVDGFVPLYEDT